MIKNSWAPIPIRTHLITAGEDILDIVKKYAVPVARSGDIIIIAESPVAISQGRAVLSSSVKSTRLAQFLSRFPKKDGNLATPAAMQVAIDEVGAFRVLLGATAGALGRLLGRQGDFYRVAGKSLAKIDDIAGTLPPFDSHIVPAPKDPQGITDKIYKEFGITVAIADVNDIRCVDILALSGDHLEENILKILEENPLGNDDQQTPLMVLKKL